MSSSLDWLGNLFQSGVYTITPSLPKDANGTYPVDTTYKITRNENIGEIPLALLYATMQIALSDVAAYKAESYMQKIQDNQDKQVACSAAINEAEKLQATITAGATTATVTQEFVDACSRAGITTLSDGTAIKVGMSLTSAQCDTLITDLELAQEEVSTSLQTDMIYAEEYLGQYNSYLTGGSSNIDELNNALQGIAARI